MGLNHCKTSGHGPPSLLLNIVFSTGEHIPQESYRARKLTNRYTNLILGRKCTTQFNTHEKAVTGWEPWPCIYLFWMCEDFSGIDRSHVNSTATTLWKIFSYFQQGMLRLPSKSPTQFWWRWAKTGTAFQRYTQLYALASLPNTQGTSVYTQASASYSTYKIRLAITSRQVKVQLV